MPLALQVVGFELAERGTAEVFRVVTALGLRAGGVFAKVDICNRLTKGGRRRRFLRAIGCGAGLCRLVAEGLVTDEVFFFSRNRLILKQRVLLPAVRVVLRSARVAVRLAPYRVKLKGRSCTGSLVEKHVVILDNFKLVIGEVLFRHGDAFLSNR
jgi:hypothetical protein